MGKSERGEDRSDRGWGLIRVTRYSSCGMRELSKRVTKRVNREPVRIDRQKDQITKEREEGGEGGGVIDAQMND
jgi:hypothetical protein